MPVGGNALDPLNDEDFGKLSLNRADEVKIRREAARIPDEYILDGFLSPHLGVFNRILMFCLEHNHIFLSLPCNISLRSFLKPNENFLILKRTKKKKFHFHVSFRAKQISATRHILHFQAGNLNIVISHARTTCPSRMRRVDHIHKVPVQGQLFTHSSFTLESA